jgi:hypothetical protein
LNGWHKSYCDGVDGFPAAASRLASRMVDETGLGLKFRIAGGPCASVEARFKLQRR